MEEKRKYIAIKRKPFLLARIIMEKQLGRKLSTNEIVHHKDGNPSNDLVDNLEVVSSVEHFWRHVKNGRTKMFGGFEKGGICSRKICSDPNKAWCNRCKQFLDKSSFAKCLSRWNGTQYWCKECRRIFRLEKKKRGSEVEFEHKGEVH